jgi:ABC-2 type transport system permease protein
MNSAWFKVAKYEFLRHLLRRGFLWAVLGMPVLFLAIGGGAAWFFSRQNDTPMGVVDNAGIFQNPDTFPPVDDDAAPLRGFTDVDTALTALEDGEIQAYFVLPADFATNSDIEFVHNGDTYDGITGDFRDYIRAGLLASEDPRLQSAFANGDLDTNFTTLAEDESLGNPLNAILPYLFGFIAAIGIFTSAGYLIQAVVDEKENRTMEILITSITPLQLVMGKIIGLVTLGLLQIGIWLLFALIGLTILASRIPDFPALSISPTMIFIAIAWFIPYYMIVASLMAAVGISVTEVSEGQQTVGIISMLSMSPLWLFALFLSAPNSPIAVAMTLNPFSSFLTILMRWGVTDIPIWQMVASWGILVGTAIFAIYLVSRVLRVGMLRYGQKLTFKDIRRLLLGGELT